MRSFAYYSMSVATGIMLSTNTLASVCGFGGYTQQTAVTLTDTSSVQSDFCLQPGQAVTVAADLNAFLSSSLGGGELLVNCSLSGLSGGAVTWKKITDVAYLQSANSSLMNNNYSYVWKVASGRVFSSLVKAAANAKHLDHSQVTLANVDGALPPANAMVQSGDIGVLQLKNDSNQAVGVHCQNASPPKNHFWEEMGIGLASVIGSILPAMASSVGALSSSADAAEIDTLEGEADSDATEVSDADKDTENTSSRIPKLDLANVTRVAGNPSVGLRMAIGLGLPEVRVTRLEIYYMQNEAEDEAMQTARATGELHPVIRAPVRLAELKDVTGNLRVELPKLFLETQNSSASSTVIDQALARDFYAGFPVSSAELGVKYLKFLQTYYGFTG